ncbi:MAG: tetratricopeptide repeat protein [Planctomycetota bacterium]
MSLAARRRRRQRRLRLALVFGVLLLIAGGVTARLVMVRQAAPAAEDPRRAAALAAHAAGDDEAALAAMTEYLADTPTDAEVLYAYGVSRQRAAADSDTEALLDAVNAYRGVLNLRPDDRAAAERLLELFVRHPQGVAAEGVRVAERLLRAEPGHRGALRALAALLPRTGRYEPALDAIDAYLAVAPDDARAHRDRLAVMDRLGRPDTDLLAYARALREARPDDPRLDLIDAAAHRLTDNRDAAIESARRAAAIDPPDADFARLVVEGFDAAGAYPLAAAYLERLAADGDPAADTDELIRRRFEAGRVEDTLALLPETPDAAPWHHRLEALALLSLGREADADAVIDRIAAGDTRGAAAVAAWLRVAATAGADDAADLLDATRRARDAGVSDPYLELMTAEAYQRTAQPERAVERFEAALRLRPSWAAPCLALARLHLDAGRTARAATFAAGAANRRPDELNARILLAEALGARPESLDPDAAERVARLIDQVQRARPGEPKTLALRIELLAARGRTEDAAAAVAEALTQPLDEPAIVNLIRVTQRHGLDPDGEVRAAYVDRFGRTLPITMVEAARLIEAGDPAAALALFDDAAPDPAPADWRINRALLLERAGDPAAPAAWADVAAGLPENLDVQRAVLRSDAAWTDRALIDATLDRVADLAGPNDPTVLTERARWHLTGGDPAAAAALLDRVLEQDPDDSAARLLLARCRRAAGRPREAVALLDRVLELRPDFAAARLERAFAQRTLGSTRPAIDAARAVAFGDDTPPALRRRAAGLLLEEGQTEAAYTTLARLADAGQTDADDRITLVQLARALPRPDELPARLDALLAEPTPAAVALAADTYAALGRTDDAAAALDLIDGLGLTPAAAASLRARHLAVHGAPRAADVAFAAAAEADPTDANAWAELADHRLRIGRTPDAVAAARTGLARLTDTSTDEPAAGLRALADHADLADALADEPRLAGLWLAMLGDPPHRVAASDALHAVAEHRRADGTPGDLADRLASFADAHPGFESLAALTVAAEIAAGRGDAAAARADAALEAFDDSPRAARLAAEAHAARGDWRSALLAAERWTDRLRRRGAADRLAADTFTARAYRQLGRPQPAVELLLPYADRLRRQPQADPSATLELALGLAAVGRSDDAWGLIGPRLGDGPVWRSAAMDAAVRVIDDTATAGQWLERVGDALPPDAHAERADWARAFWVLGRRVGHDPYVQLGRRAVSQLLADDRGDAELWFFAGTMAEIDRELDTAERHYRRALALEPGLAPAANNLAMVLADGGGDLDEALAFARAAVAAAPEDPNYHDTLAHVLRRAGRLDEARAAIQRAIDLDPGNPQWRQRLNEMAAAG